LVKKETAFPLRVAEKTPSRPPIEGMAASGGPTLNGDVATIRVGGVPEHFNAPFHVAHSRGLYRQNHIDFHWQDFAGGTGAMTKALSERTIDVAILLSEGIVADIAKGSSNRIVGTYVRSPLTWGIHTSAKNTNIQSASDLKGLVYGVSRMGSGSHLMAYVDARSRGWDPSHDLQLKVVGSLDGAREAMDKGEIQAFMWEKYTTKWLCDSGEWKRVGECVTPWPCFLVAAHKDVIATHGVAIRKLLEVTRLVCHEIETQKSSWVDYFSDNYKNTKEDAAAWLAGVHWSCEPVVTDTTVTDCVNALASLDLIASPTPSVADVVTCLPGEANEDHLHAMYWYRKRQIMADIEAALATKPEGGGLDPSEEETLTHYHYWGNDAVNTACEKLGLKSQTGSGRPCRILDAGSGLGGVCRYWVHSLQPAHCSVVGVEIQQELHNLADDLTKRARLTDRVTHICGDLCTVTKDECGGLFDGAYSFLVFLHVADRHALFKNIRSLLKPGAILYAEDYYQREPFTAEDEEILTNYVACKNLPTLTQYKEHLEASGFESVHFEDVTGRFREFVNQRAAAFNAKYDEKAAKHGQHVAASFRRFYEGVAKVWNGGRVGGVRVTAVAGAVASGT